MKCGACEPESEEGRRRSAASSGRAGAAEQRGGAVPATSGVHTLQRPGPGDLWNVLALTEQRRRRAQATLGLSARPQRQAAQPIGQKPARARSSLACMLRQSRLGPPLLPEAPLAASARPQLRLPAPGSLHLPPLPRLSQRPPRYRESRRAAAPRGAGIRPRGRALSVWAPRGKMAVGSPPPLPRPGRVPV